ncbi:diacylglycerol/lipid kinase family protein [Salisediminibacterium beveridgei]|uniref:Transcription regulator (Contains diacylglycerol kinase catalytic domain) n=1 Tax=Salisediminibacterium beveridgei TaxID=632773 RepID=A0A1D7QV88_9BACI|nr:YegS/Rv2252/BmrU family lipid kinase [Salisediminibacterium beveridgei]AOM82925.1 Transcription regulator (contains diacylglycerol kinase catalytic domain) [Salisediminibacterium beveridgei]
MYNKGLLIYNEHAGNQDKYNQIGEAVKAITPYVRALTIQKSEAPGDIEQIAAEKGVEMDIVFVMGGDGTLHEAINGIAPLKERPVIGILPAGTSNDFARSIGVPIHVKNAALLAGQGKETAVDLGQINERYFINFAGVGLVTQVSENIDENLKQTTGPFSYMYSALKTVQETSQPFRYKIIDDENQQHAGTAVMIAVLNGKSIGTTEIPFANEMPDQGSMKLVIVREAGLHLFREWLQFKVKPESPQEEPSIEVYDTASFTLTTEDKMDVDTDGETYQESHFVFQALPAYIRFLIPLE